MYVYAAVCVCGCGRAHQERAAKWRTSDGLMDGLTTNGVLVMHPAGEFVSEPAPGLWREISVCGNVYALRETRSAQQRGKLVRGDGEWGRAVARSPNRENEPNPPPRPSVCLKTHFKQASGCSALKQISKETHRDSTQWRCDID